MKTALMAKNNSTTQNGTKMDAAMVEVSAEVMVFLEKELKAKSFCMVSLNLDLLLLFLA